MVASVSAANRAARLQRRRTRAGVFRERRLRPRRAAVLQPTGPFLDMSGEDIRGRLFLTSGSEGEELCLRPDYTIPVCLLHLGAGERRRRAALRLSRTRSFAPAPARKASCVQTGLESFGRRDIEAADAEILALAMEAAEKAGSKPLKVKIGDARRVRGVISALGLPEYWRRRVRRGVARGQPLEKVLDSSGLTPFSKAGVLAALERADHDGAKALVQDLLAMAGIATVGGRSPSEIADRFLEQAATRLDDGIGAEQIEALRPLPGDFRPSRRGVAGSCASLRGRRGSTSARRSPRSTSASVSSPRAACRSTR